MVKKHYWVGFNKSGYILDITVKDDTNSKLESWEVSTNDEKAKRKVIRTLREKYNITLTTKPKLMDSQDLDWLK